MADPELLPPLPDIDDVRPVDETDQVVFDEVRALLERHGALQRFGLTLLHQHFDLTPTETLVEHIDKESRTLTIQPRSALDPARSIETSWRLDSPTGRQRCEVMCERVPDRYGGGHRRNHYTTG